MASLSAVWRPETASTLLTVDGASWLSGVTTNLHTVPSFEASAASTEVWRNYAWDPRATANSTTGTNRVGWSPSWYGTAGAGATSLVTGAADGPLLADGLTRIATYMRKTWSTAPTANGSTAFDHTAGNDTNAGGTTKGLVVTPGQVWTISTWVRPSANRAAGYYIRAYWRDASFAYLSTQVGTTVTATVGQWARISATFTVPANAVRMSIRTDTLTDSTNPWQPGDTLDGTGLLVEMYPTLRDYYDHLYSPDADLTPSATGTANASPSILSGVGVAGVSGGNACVLIQSNKWASSGSKCLRIIPTGSDASTGAVIRTFAAGDVGKTFTVLATAYLPAAITGTQQTNARRIFTLDPANSAGPQAPNVPGSYGMRWTFTVTAANQTLRLGGGGGVGGGDVYWDCAMLVEGVYTGPWWDGSHPPGISPLEAVAWAGTVDQSQSTLTIPAVTAVTLTRTSPGATSQLVRGVINKPVVGGYLVATDHEMDLNSSVTYTVTGYSAAGAVVGTASATVATTQTEPGCWVKIAGRPDLTVFCQIAGLGEIGSATVGGVYQVIGGGSVAVAQYGGVAPTTASVTLRTDTGAQTAQLRTLLETARIVLLQPIQSDLDPGWYFTSQANRSNPAGFYDFGFRYTGLQLTSAQAPAGQQGGATWTWSSVKGAYATWDAVKAAKASWFAVEQGA